MLCFSVPSPCFCQFLLPCLFWRCICGGIVLFASHFLVGSTDFLLKNSRPAYICILFEKNSFPIFMVPFVVMSFSSFLTWVDNCTLIMHPAVWVPVGPRFQKKWMLKLFQSYLIFLLQGIMVSDDYIKIIKDGLLQSARDMGMGRWRWIFQQDNDPKVRNYCFSFC